MQVFIIFNRKSKISPRSRIINRQIHRDSCAHKPKPNHPNFDVTRTRARAFVRNFATMPGPTLDFSFLNAAARGGDVSKHVEETYVRDDDECEIFVEPFSQPRMFECARNVD